jgi:hypothetical protein
MSTLLTYLFWGLPVFLLLAEIGAAIYLSHRQVRRRMLYIVASYLFLVAAAIGLALVARDEFGFSAIPAILITAPWYFIPGFANPYFSATILVGVILNCSLFTLVDRLSYPRVSAKLSPPQAT